MRSVTASILAAGVFALGLLPFDASRPALAAAAQATPPAATPDAKAPAAKPKAAKAKPAAKSTKKPAAAKATPAKATSGGAARPDKKPAAGKPTAKPAAKPLPGRAVETKIGEVMSVDYPDVGEVRLDGPWREHGYPLRLWMTSYVRKDTGQRRHLLSVQVTHHEQAARNYVRAELGSPSPVAVTQTARPSLQCTRNRDGSRQCFHTEAYAFDLPEDVLTHARAAGTTITLAADPAEPFKVPLDAATIDAQLKACESVTPVVAAEKKP